MPRSNAASSPATAAPLKRLPVNPRRKKVPIEERRRVATACNSCNIRRIKCSGSRPCQQCANSQRKCEYPPPVAKVTVTKDEWDDMKETLQWYAPISHTFDHLRYDQQPLEGPSGAVAVDVAGTAEAGPSVEPPGETLADGQDTTGYGDSESNAVFERNDMQQGKGKMLADGRGTSRYHGETSGATFLDSLKHFISTFNNPVADDDPMGEPEGLYQTDDSCPLLLPEYVDDEWLPPMEEMQSMLNELRGFIMDGQSFASGGVYFWPMNDLDQLLGRLSQPPNTRRTPDERTKRGLALYNACFAFATLLRSRNPGSRKNRSDGVGEAFIARARKLLGNPLDLHLYSIDDVPALALMALYYVENNRRDFAFSFINIAMNLSRMHGLERGSSVLPSQHRVFWTLYILDRWLSCLMGRIPSIPDFAIPLPLPQECRGLPSPLGLRAHVELSHISEFIVHNSYRGYPADPSKLPEGVQKAQSMLERWRANLPDALKIDATPDDDVYVLPNFNEKLEYTHDRAHCSLHMAYNQLYILTVRPAFLGAVKSHVANKILSQSEFVLSNDMENELRKCSNKARETIALASVLRGDGVSETFWQEITPGTKPLLLQELHHLFNASIILLMYQIVFINLRTSHTQGIEFTCRVFKEEAIIGSAYAEDCRVVLENLRDLVWKLRHVIYDSPPEPTPREQIGSSLMRTSFAFEAPTAGFTADNMAFQPFSGHGLSPRVRSTLEPTTTLPLRQHGSPEATLLSHPEMQQELESWAAKTVTESYNGGGCMVDNRK